MKKFFITGTDTEVGKTFVTCLICKSLKNSGFKVGTLKPIESGLDNNSFPDFLKLAKASGDREKKLYLLSKPLAPYIASKIDNVIIKPEKILNFYHNDISENYYDYYFIEGAGGLFVPISENCLYIDLIKEFKVEVIIIARANLGTVNHTLLSLEALEKRDIPIKGVILNEIVKTDDFMIENNVYMIEKFSGYEVLSVIRNNQKNLNANFL